MKLGETTKKEPYVAEGLGALFLGFFMLTQVVGVGQQNIAPASSSSQQQEATTSAANGALEEAVLPPELLIPVQWGDMGKQLVEKGVIDGKRFETIYNQRGGLTEEERQLLFGANNGNLVMTEQNAGYLLNLLWAFGLANKNPILEQGPMQDPRYGGAENFASTGGWTLAKGTAMDHYSGYELVKLSEEQQRLVEEVSKNIYRPCCGNPTYFPDCNHGMAMLGLLELLASQGATEEQMYKIALQANSYWFPDTYLTIAIYFEKRGVPWKNVDPKEVLGSAYSSALGFRNVLQEVSPPDQRGGGSCGL